MNIDNLQRSPEHVHAALKETEGSLVANDEEAATVVEALAAVNSDKE